MIGSALGRDVDGPVVVGVVHLLPLPGAPRGRVSLDEVVQAAVRDARAYEQSGTDAVIVENYGDAPFLKNQVEPHTVAAMTLAVRAVMEGVSLPVGINVLRNDALAAVGIAAMTAASFVRINVHTGVTVTDQGIIEGRADHTLRYRRAVDADVAIWADVLVKHGAPLGAPSIAEAAEDAVARGLADAVIVTGRATGSSPDVTDLVGVRAVLPDTPIFVGSGATPTTVAAFLPAASGFIVGTWAKSGGRISNPVDPRRVRVLIDAVHSAGGVGR